MNLCVVGNGKIVNDLFDALKEIDDIHVSAIVGRVSSKDKLLKRQQQENINHVYYSYEEALKDTSIDMYYIALPNHLHYEYAKKALLSNKHVILEKPFTNNLFEAKELVEIAKERKLLLLEAITSQYMPLFHTLKEQLKQVGNIKIIHCNFSQYSSRYDAFKEGKILPAFDVNCSGGALMDINLYNIYLMIGLFGKPETMKYYANIQKNIDTSGVIYMQYPSFIGNCIGAKDSHSDSNVIIEGDEGTITIPSASSILDSLIIKDHHGNETIISNDGSHRMVDEFKAFNEIYKNKDYETCYKSLEKTLDVMEILDLCRKDAGIQIIDQRGE